MLRLFPYILEFFKKCIKGHPTTSPIEEREGVQVQLKTQFWLIMKWLLIWINTQMADDYLDALFIYLCSNSALGKRENWLLIFLFYLLLVHVRVLKFVLFI